MKAKYTLNRLYEFDLNNHKDISINDIVDTIMLYIKDDNFSEIVYQIGSKIKNKERLKSLLKKLNIRNEQICNNKLNTPLFTLDSGIDIELNISSIILQLKKDLFLDVINRLLPLEDKNIKYKEQQFINTKKRLALLLRQMGKIKESEYIVNIQADKFHTFSSYTKKWKKEKIYYLKINYSIGKIRATEILSNIIKEVKNDYEQLNII